MPPFTACNGQLVTFQMLASPSILHHSSMILLARSQGPIIPQGHKLPTNNCLPSSQFWLVATLLKRDPDVWFFHLSWRASFCYWLATCVCVYISSHNAKDRCAEKSTNARTDSSLLNMSNMTPSSPRQDYAKLVLSEPLKRKVHSHILAVGLPSAYLWLDHAP